MRYYFIILVLFEVVAGFVLYKVHISKLDDIHKNEVHLLQQTFNSTVNTFEIANDDFHSQHSYEIAQMVQDANGASQAKRDETRKKLLNAFMTFYTSKKLYALEGMHVFDKKGHSLLRFHNPSKYDDPIIDLRSSLQKMLEDFSYRKGLELGSYKESYRFQYPLFYDGDFVGSYEYSVPFKALQNEMKKFYASQYILLLNANKVNRVVQPATIKKRYKKVSIKGKDFYYQDSVIESKFEKENLAHILALNNIEDAFKPKDINIIEYTFKQHHYDLILKPITDINKQDIGYVLVVIDNDHTEFLDKEFFLNAFLISLFNIMVFIYIIKQIKHRLYIRELINMQHDILLVTDGEKIKDANNALTDFFGYTSLAKFSKDHACVCNFFIEQEGFLQKYNDGVIWTQYLIDNTDKKHRVKIKDPKQDKEIKVFEIEYETFDNTKYLFLLFRDITQEHRRYNELMNRANFDALTNIYNRGSFEYYLNVELKRARDEGAFSLIMFDIDHFKKVNDEYGHDIGDSVLKELSGLIASHIREKDIFARWGGEEFMIISTNSLNHCEIFAEKLRQIVHSHTFKEVGEITCSFGITHYHLNDTKESIVKRSDNMLYSAKESGRNCVVSIR